MPKPPPSRPWAAALALLAGCLALPASGHMLTRGTPLSELAAGAPTAVVGVVQSRRIAEDGPRVALAVEHGVLGDVVAGTLHFALESHHPPAFEVGRRVLVFLTSSTPPFASRQTALDVVELPDQPAAIGAIVKAVRAYAGLREVPGRPQRLARLKALSLDHLESPSAALHREALLDLLAIGAGDALDAADVARVGRLARRPDVAPTLGPGLVMLLASVDRADGAAALADLARHAESPQVRALAAQSLDRRGGARRATPDPTAPTTSKGRES